MQITYSELEDFLAYAHGVSPEKRAALKGRLKHFQRLGWPSGTNKGKGARVQYGVGQTLLLAMGLELLQLGLTPERVISELKYGGGLIAEGFLSALEDYRIERENVYFILSPENLRSLRGIDDNEETTSFALVTSQQNITEILLSGVISSYRRLALVSVSNILDDYISYFMDKGLDSPDSLKDPLEKWKETESRSIERLTKQAKTAINDRNP